MNIAVCYCIKFGLTSIKQTTLSKKRFSTHIFTHVWYTYFLAAKLF